MVAPDQQERSLVDISFQVELLQAVRELASSMDISLVINARTDVYLLPTGDAGSRFEQAVQRGHAYRQAGADCFFPIDLNDARIIADLVAAVEMPVNILANSATPSIPELARLGVARVSFGSGPMCAALGYLRRVAGELLESGTYASMTEGAVSGAELRFF